MNIKTVCKNAKLSSKILLQISDEKRDLALEILEKKLINTIDEILAANKKDLEAAKDNKLAPTLLNRLSLSEKKVHQMAREVASVKSLPNPLGKVLDRIKLDDELVLEKITCPIGVITTVFESRPDAVTQITSLAVKSGNALILKGGSEAFNSNKILYKLISASLTEAGLPSESLTLIETREQVGELLKYDDYIDLVIPRGSNQFVRMIKENSRIPVLGHADGICHLYADAAADIKKLIPLIIDSKTQYPAACNALETLLLHREVADKYFAKIKESLELMHVELRGCELCHGIKKASEEDWKTEYGDLILAIKVVNDLDEAINHINKYGSGHTDTIVTEDDVNAATFCQTVDSSSVMHNASTRFADGFRYGMGAEVGISTNKIHARGPVGLEGLTINKFVLKGDGHIVADYSDGKKNFKHERT